MGAPRLRWLVRLISMGLLAFVAGCHGGKPLRFHRVPKKAAVPSQSSFVEAGPTMAPISPGGPRPMAFNVLILTVDALRVDLPWLGYARNTAPRLTELAKESVVYTNAYSVSSSTSKSLAALFTGRFPSMLYRSGWFFAGYTETERFLARALHERGIATIGWQEHPYLKHAQGLSSGYSTWSPVPVHQTDPGGDARSTSRDVAEKGIELLGMPENTGHQFFAWTHAMDPHEDYVKHPECPDFGEAERDRYDSEVCFTDKGLGQLLDWAHKQPWWENTVVIVTSDHGEIFGEHGMAHHAFELWEPLVHVPLVIRVPGVSPKRIEQRRSQIDLAPTILELMGQPASSGFSGKSLVPEILGTAAPDLREPIVLDLPEDTHEQSRRAIIEGSYKLIAFGAGRFALYNIMTDPNESKDLAAREPQVLARMKQRMQEIEAKIPFVEPYGGMKLASGHIANGPMRPAH